jgi:hypothetical protein
MNRISRKHLDAKVRTINRLMKENEEPYGKDEEGNFKANIGTFLIDSHSPADRNGTRYSLARICTHGGGQSTVIPTVCGAGNFADCLSALINGIYMCQEKAKLDAK